MAWHGNTSGGEACKSVPVPLRCGAARCGGAGNLRSRRRDADRPHHEDHACLAFVAGIFTMTASYRIGREWTARFSWNRVLSNYDRDADVLLFGVGYRF